MEVFLIFIGFGFVAAIIVALVVRHIGGNEGFVPEAPGTQGSSGKALRTNNCTRVNSPGSDVVDSGTYVSGCDGSSC